MKKLSFAVLSCTLLGLFNTGPASAEPLGMPTRSTPDAEQNSHQANKLFEQAYQEMLERSPMALTRVGSRQFYDRWDDLSPEEADAQYRLQLKWARTLREKFEGQPLDRETALSLKLFLYNAEQAQAGHPYEDYIYPVNQMFGLQAEVPAFLINNHQISSRWEAEAYITRLERLPALFAQLNDGLLRREKKGLMLPRFAFDLALSDVANLLTGYPLTEGPEEHPIFADFKKKVQALGLDSQQKQQLVDRCERALVNQWADAYRSLRETLLAQQSRATDEDGVWKFPNGDKYYAQTLARATTTDLSADQIHQIGLDEVKRIHGEMRQIMKRVGFEGTLQEFFTFMRDDPRFYYSNDATGKQAYLHKAERVVDDMKKELDQLFLTKPKADLVVKAVEPYREKTAGKAFYEAPALDGSRPGYYYANLYDMKSMPNYQMEALAYHEGIPGHHMQLSIAQELEQLPTFRRTTSHTAYIEGWGLYCEQLPKEFGFYQDPYADFGRLAMELWRACRLVVDTGIHHKKWSRQEAVDYYHNNTPNAIEDCRKMVDRHIVMPGQATSYKIGMLEILRLRESAKERLGKDFDIREFHDVVLTHGSVPLAVLEELVEQYVAEKKT